MVFVADHAEIAGTLRERLHQQILHAVGILVFIHQQMLRALLPSREDVGKVAEQPVGRQEQVAEIERVHLGQPRLIKLIDLRKDPVAAIRGVTRAVFGKERLVLGLIKP